MSCFYRIFNLLFFLFCIFSSYSQDFIYKHYDLQDGLASLTIHSIFQDKDGFLWFGTESGLCRYDGSRFKTFTIKDGLQGNEVFGMMQDRKGRIWLQQYKSSIAYIYNGKVYNQENDSTLKKIKLASRLYGVAEDGEGNIGLCDISTMYIILNDHETIKTVNRVNGNPSVMVSLSTDDAKQFILCSNRELYKVENYQFKYVRTISARAEIGQTSILLHPNYIVFDNTGTMKLIYLKDTTIEYKQVTNGVLKCSAVSDSVFSMNTIDGAVLFNIKDYSSLKILPGIKVTNVYMDTENNLWLGTMGKGIYKLSSRVILNKKISDSENDIVYLTKAGNKIIAGNNNLQIYEYNQKKFVHQPFNKQKPNPGKILYYERISKGKYLIANVRGLAVYNKGMPEKLLYLITLKHVARFDGSDLLLSVHSGLYIARKNDQEITDTIWNRRTLCSFRTGDSILAGTSAGVFVMKKNKGKWFIADSLLNSSIIAFIGKSNDNLIWICTYEDGLYCIKDGKIIRHFTDSNGLPGNNGRSLYVHGNDVWLGTDRGLVKISPGNTGFRLQKYSISDGLASDNVNSIYVDGDTVYIGTPEGLCYFDETKIGTTSICNLVLTGVSIGDSTADFRDKYFLHRSQRFVAEFSGISFRSEKEMTYRYKINGIDDDWRTTTLNSLEFTSLPYGDYELEIIAINKFGKESVPLKIKFNIARPFYKTTWFIVLIALVVVSAVLFLYNRWLNFRKQKQLQKLKQEIKLLELEQMALRAQMNPHFIFNCISAMQQLIMENDVDNANKFITSFASLVRQTLDNAPELFIPLKEEIKFLTSYFELEKIRLEERFSYIINTENTGSIDSLYVPNMVIQPFVENAIKHGVRYKKDGKGLIEVNFAQEDTILRCTITDNGIGREKAGQMKTQSGVYHTSKGIGITFKRIESLNTLMNGKISIVIHDLKDENDKALGTKVVIDFYKL